MWVTERLGLHRLKGEERHIVGGNPRRAQPRRDRRRRQILGLDALQRLDIAGIGRDRGRRRRLRPELGAHRAREIGVGRLPGLRLGIAEHGVAEFGENIVLFAAEQGGDARRIDAAGLVQRDGERVGGVLDHGRSRWGDHPLGEDGAMAGDAALEVIFLDRGDEPAIGIVEERREIRAAMRLPHLAGLGIGLRGDGGEIDRPEIADERRVGDAQRALRVRPGLIGFLRAQDLAHRVADRNEAADDAGGLRSGCRRRCGGA